MRQKNVCKMEEEGTRVEQRRRKGWDSSGHLTTDDNDVRGA